MSAPGSEVGWQEDHALDFLAIHEALQAFAEIDLSGTAHTDWLLTVRTVRDRVASFSLLVPNAPKLITLLDTAEKALLAIAAVQNLAKDA